MAASALDAGGGEHAVHTIGEPENVPSVVLHVRASGDAPQEPTLQDHDHCAPDTNTEVARGAAGGAHAEHVPPLFTTQFAVVEPALQPDVPPKQRVRVDHARVNVQVPGPAPQVPALHTNVQVVLRLSGRMRRGWGGGLVLEQLFTRSFHALQG